MQVIHARNVNEAYFFGTRMLREEGMRRDSRNGPVMEMKTPVTTVTYKPCERVLFSPERDANPFFHLMEALWMLGGRRDVEFPALFNGRIHQYSDDGRIFYGAYGYRWRSTFGFDQLQAAIQELRADPLSRRVVLTMWSPELDLRQGQRMARTHQREYKDLPCNTQIYFKVRPNGHLDMTISNRSNDAIWGAHGANAVHMSLLQEYVAEMTGYNVGVMYQVSDNYHAYEDILDQHAMDAMKDHYVSRSQDMALVPVVDNPDTFDEELQAWLENPAGGHHCDNHILSEVATPMYLAWARHKSREYNLAYNECEDIRATDWRLACTEWLARREAKWKE